MKRGDPPALGDKERMNAPEAEAAYHQVKSQLDAHQISLDEYNQKVAALQYLDNTGTWWAISPGDGSWLRWNGTAWEPAFGSGAPSRIEQQQENPSSDIPAEYRGHPEKKAAGISAAGAPASNLPWPMGKKFAAGSIACGALSFIIFPYILGIAGVVLGIAALRQRCTSGAIGVVVSAAVISLAYLTTLHP